MFAARVGHALKGLRTSAAVISATAAVFTVIIDPPPRHPGSERKIAAIWRRVVGRRRRNGPIGFGIGKTAAGVIFRLDRKLSPSRRQNAGLRIRPLSKPQIRAGEIPVSGTDANSCCLRAADRRKVDPRVAQIGVVGEREFEIEGAERVQRRRAFSDLVILCGSLTEYVQTACRVAEPLDIAELAGRHFADIALDRDFFLRLVHLAVVKDEPAEGVGSGSFLYQVPLVCQ